MVSKAPHRTIAAAVIIDGWGRLLLQLRDDIPTIRYPGKLGLFGGHRQGDETPLECVVREVHEELTYYIPPGRFSFLATREDVDSEVIGGTMRADFFVVRDVPTHELAITEGTLVVAALREVGAIDHKLTPNARFALKAFLRLGRRKLF
jgi:8-oxo-dGTP diphosphatase